MSFIRRNPFVKEDPKIYMIDCVAEEALRLGQPLTETERQLLATENAEVEIQTERRLRALISRLVENENSQPADHSKRSFLNAIEWATDIEWPYIVALSVAVLKNESKVEKVTRRDMTGWKAILLILLLIGVVLAILIGLILLGVRLFR